MRNLGAAVGSVALIRVDTGSFLGPAAKLSLLNQLSLGSTRNPVSKQNEESSRKPLAWISVLYVQTHLHPSL